MESMDIRCVRSCWRNYGFDHIHGNSVGNSGGILCVWDPNSFKKNSYTISDFFVIIRGLWLKSGVNILIVVVYGPHDPRDKRIMWDYLAHSFNQWDGEVIVMGDFNEVRYKTDRFGSVFNINGANEFNAFIANVGLEEVPLGRSKFTWCHKSATKMSKLDRFFISDNLFNMLPNITAVTLDRYLSDHRPILLRENVNNYGPIPFRFFHHWIELEGFDKYVIDMWKIAPGDVNNGMISLMGKMKFVKVKIREWIRRNMNDRKGRREKYKKEISTLDVEIDNGNGTEAVVNKRLEVLNELQNLDKFNDMDVAQKAKIKWAVEGDENSRFFHGMLNRKRHQQSIWGVMADGVWKDKPSDVKLEFLSHFSNRFSKPSDGRATIDMQFPRYLDVEQQEDLEREVSNEEIKKAVWDCGTDKSPGPDGFNFVFYRHFWSTIEKDVVEAVRYFFTNANFPKGCNSSFIALILKIPDANMVKDFRPICLIGSMYKIIAKILSNWLVGVLGDIVSEVQSAFIAERQILDGPFILNEVLQWCKRKKK
ncbi:RNA-directed DNA polymerase, eukaryota [Tanacetum coccineum]